jgi:hypothetical protein
MHPQLDAVRRELEDATARARRLADQASDDEWQRRPGEGRWSMGECIAHLSLTAEIMLPAIRSALAGARRPPTTPPRYRRDAMGWFLSKILEPPVRRRVVTGVAFIPKGAAPKAPTLADFERWQGALIETLADLDGHDLSRLKVTSPFNAAVRYNLYSAYCIITAHERRHLWQAEQVRDAIRAVSSAA